MKKLAFFTGLAIAIIVSAQFAGAEQVINDTLRVSSLIVGEQGVGGVTFFNGTIVNNTTDSDGGNNPVTFGDNVRIDGRIYRGATPGSSDSQPLLVNDNMEVVGSLTVGSTNVLNAISSNSSLFSGYMPQSTYDVAGNSKIDADKLDSGISTTLLGAGAISNTELGYLNGVTSNLQTQLNTKGVGDMLKSTYDVAGNSKIDASKLDSGIAATLIGGGTISNAEYAYLNGVTSNLQTQLNTKGVGDMLKSVYDVAGNSKIDAGKLDSGIAATLIGGGTISDAEYAFLNGVSSNLQTQLNAKGVGDMLKSTYDVAGNSKIDAGKLDSGIAATLIGGGGVSNTLFDYLANWNMDNTSDLRLTAIGYQAGNAIEANGYRNTLIGFQVGDIITTGTDNTALGNNALGALVTSNQNTAVGSGALALNTAADNTAMGYNALGANTTGSGNTAFGFGSLDANTGTGQRNTAVGHNSLGANTNGTYNTAVGYNAIGNMSGSYNNNTAVGYFALDAVVASSDNTAVGYQALTATTSGQQLAAFGSGALDANTEGDFNTAIGYAAMGLNTIGSNNTTLGYQAGDGISSGDGNIIIGYQADTVAGGTDNFLNIGGSLYGDLANDYIGIGNYAGGAPANAMLNILQTGTVPHLQLNPIASAPTTDVTEGDVYMNTDGILYVRSNSAWAAMNTAADFSELLVPFGFKGDIGDGVRMYSGEINAGDVIVIDRYGNYTRSTSPYDSAVVGVESGNRGRFYLHEDSPDRALGQRQVGLIGHVLVNVTLENGPIYPGDPLTTSATPGHAMKATLSGATIGKALGFFDGSQGQTGMIEVLVDPGWFGGQQLCRLR